VILIHSFEVGIACGVGLGGLNEVKMIGLRDQRAEGAQVGRVHLSRVAVVSACPPLEGLRSRDAGLARWK